MSNTILILSIILTVFVLIMTYMKCPEGEFKKCLDSNSVVIDDVTDCIWVIRVLLETFLE
jgi:hypothetical protein